MFAGERIERNSFSKQGRKNVTLVSCRVTINFGLAFLKAAPKQRCDRPVASTKTEFGKHQGEPRHSKARL